MEKEKNFIVFDGVTIFQKYIVSFQEFFDEEKQKYLVYISTTSSFLAMEEGFESEAKALDKIKELVNQMDKKFLLVPFLNGFVVADKIYSFLMLKNDKQPQGHFYYAKIDHCLCQKNDEDSYFLLFSLDNGYEILLSFSNEEDMKTELAKIKENKELSKKLFSLHNAGLATEKIANLSVYKNSDLGIKHMELDDRYVYLYVNFFNSGGITFRYDTKEEAEKDKKRIIKFNSKILSDGK